MKRLTSAIGMGLLLAQPLQAIAATQWSLYETIHKTVEQEQSIETADPDLKDYLAAVFKQPVEAIEEVLKGNTVKACDLAKLTEQAPCSEFMLRVMQTAKRELGVRSLGRKLQEIASGEESAVSFLPDKAAGLVMNLNALLSMWSSGDGSHITQSGTTVAVRSLSSATTNPLLAQLKTRLEALPTEERIAAVWRYDRGVRAVITQPVPADATEGTERQFLFKRWNSDPANIEQTLLSLWNSLPQTGAAAADVTYFLIPNAQGTLPENILVWARKLKNGEGDAGLAWNLALQPVLPSLVKRAAGNGANTAIVGGLYPPEPATNGTAGPAGTKLCSDPLSAKGYLCSPARVAGCPVPPGRDPQAIHLINCTVSKETATTSGPNSCLAQDWRTTPIAAGKPGFDVNTQCVVDPKNDLSCDSATGFTGRTYPKDPNGHIQMAVGNPQQGALRIPATYIWIHELVHARQSCAFPPNHSFYHAGPNPQIPAEGLSPQQKQENIATCCNNEGEAYRAQCNAMEEDGMFVDPATGKRIVVNGVEITAAVCAEVYTDASCLERTGGHCPRTREYVNGMEFALRMEDIAGNLAPAKTRMSCTAAINPKTMDPRMKAQIDEINSQYDLATPGRTATFRNSIGNNLCYIGQATEQVLEKERITPGRSPTTIFDQESPREGTSQVPLSAQATASTTLDAPAVSIPSYRPQLVAEQFDAALCQQQGLPPQTPPLLCTLQYLRRLQLPLSEYILNSQSLDALQGEQSQPFNDYKDLAPGLGMRLATGIYEQHAPPVLGSLTQLLEEAVRQLKQLSAIPFTAQMCPLRPGS